MPAADRPVWRLHPRRRRSRSEDVSLRRVTGCGRSRSGKQTEFLSTYDVNMIVLPRHARDKHKEKSQRSTVAFQDEPPLDVDYDWFMDRIWPVLVRCLPVHMHKTQIDMQAGSQPDKREQIDRVLMRTCVRASSV